MSSDTLIDPSVDAVPALTDRLLSMNARQAGPRRALHRVGQLDLLRALAILLVIFHHSGIDPTAAGMFAPLFRRIQEIGWIGVDCFFVLSGFLIGGLLFAEIGKTGALDARRFLLRRAFKIWPQYFVYLAFCFILGTFCFDRTVWAQLRMMAFTFVHLQNYSRRWESHLWSLAVEEHFYLLLPAVLLGAVVIRRRRMQTHIPLFAVGTIGVMALVLAGRIFLLRFPFNKQLHYFGTHARLDSLALGVLIAYLSQFNSDLWQRLLDSRRGLAVLGVVLLLPVVLFAPKADHPFTHSVGYTLLALGFGCLLIASLGVQRESLAGRWIDGRIAAVLAWIGMNSYGIYLWHQEAVINPIHKWGDPLLAGAPGIVRFTLLFIVIIGLSLFVGFLSTMLIERPTLALRDRVWPSRSRSM
jgi:peptidoglycan/LPS O-acetylase OafA/YrhL